MTKLPKVGTPVRGSQSGRPVMVLLDLLGRRWCLRILWELQTGPRTFRDLQTQCDGLSPTVLNTRIKELRESGLVAHHASEGYSLTPAARELSRHLLDMSKWADTWLATTEGP